MTDQRFAATGGRYNAVICARALATILLLCRRGWPRETGGVLIGHYGPHLDTAFVTDVLPPPSDSATGYSWFVRGVRGLATRLHRLWHSRPRRYYLGEWHLHPGAAPMPSQQDRVQMQTIADGEHGCPTPLLVLVGGSPEATWELAVWAFRRGRKALRLDRCLD